MEQDWWKFEFSQTDCHTAVNPDELKQLNQELEDVKVAAKRVLVAVQQSKINRAKHGGFTKEEKHVMDKLQQTRSEIIERAKKILAQKIDKLDQLKNFVDCMKELKTRVSDIQKQLDSLHNTDDPLFKKVCDEFNTIYSKMSQHATKLSINVPWQLYYMLLRLPNESKTDFSGGRVTDKSGKNINEARCALCGSVVQHWSIGEGFPRYHCMDADLDLHVDEHELLMNAKRMVEKMNKDVRDQGMEMLKQLDPHIASIWVLENNILTFLRFPVAETKTPADFIAKAFDAYANRLCIGTNSSIVKEMCTFGIEEMIECDGYSWLTYKQVGKYAKNLASGMRSFIPRGTFVGIMGLNRNEWIISDFACALAGLIIVGLHTTYQSEGLKNVITNAQLGAIICGKAQLNQILKVIDSYPSVKHIILMDEVEQLHNYREKYKPVSFHFIKHVADPKNSNYSHVTIEEPSKQPQDGENGIFTLLYTSGSSGVPKGVIVPAKVFRTDIGSPIFNQPLVGVSFIPLSHSSDRLRCWEFLGNGGRVGFANYDHTNWIDHETVKKDAMLEAATGENNVNSLMENVALIRPVAFAGPPRIWNGLFHIFNERVKSLRKKMDSNSAEEMILKEIASKFGNRLQTIVTGGAHTSPEVMSFIQRLLPSARFSESYGATEVGGLYKLVILISIIAITENGKPMPGVDIKLFDIPEKGFTSKDKPYPRGEIVVKTRCTSPGYYRDPDQTAKNFTKDGYFKTGDLGYFDETGRLHILERVSAVFSLSNGEIICPSKLESIYEGSKLVKQILIYGDTTKKFIIALIVPNNIETVKEKVVESLYQIAKEKGLRNYQIPRDVYLCKEEWTCENGLLNIHLKKQRNAIIKKYETAIQQLYYDLTR